MPTRSRKRKAMSAIRKLWRSAVERQLDDDDDSSSADKEQDDIAALYIVLRAKRYISPRRRVSRPPSRIQFYLGSMPESEFKHHFRLSRQFFLAVCTLIADHEEFQSVPGKHQKMSVELHLMRLL
ncbi:hypothetical protein PR002_g5668 [Phytophthora rubi]|uniref:Uncharacterized protein n=1 Tax=Phytophthora rubi TaxID=129364 RepID=A0A6A3NDR0_9STRA|nr:hypothetical protein PR002_g5668 [Phytophthora rubi]